MIAVGVGIAANVVLAYLLVFHTRLGFFGAPLALALAEWIMFGAMMFYMWIYYDYVTEVYDTPEEAENDTCGAESGKQNGGHAFTIAEDEEFLEDIEDASPNGEEDEDRKDEYQRDEPTDGESVALHARAKEEPTESSENTSAEKVLVGRTWQGFSVRESFSGWKEFTLLALPGAIQLTTQVCCLN